MLRITLTFTIIPKSTIFVAWKTPNWFSIFLIHGLNRDLI